MTTFATDREAFLADIRRIAHDVAAVHADDVDANARFPAEAVTALREAGALSALVPTELGGAGLPLSVIAQACRELPRGCSATAMVFAMHQLQVANIVRHIDFGSWHGDYLRRLSSEQRLISSVTSELGTGGDMARSIAAVQPLGDGRVSFTKQAPTASYAAHSDDILTSLRRSPEAEESDQVMVLTTQDETGLEPTGVWDTLGMRGTCSPGFTVTATCNADQILSSSFADMMSETIVPVSHILWANVWLGIGMEAYERGRAFARASARRSPGQTSPTARQLSDVMLELRLVRSEVDSALTDFEAWDSSENRSELKSIATSVRFNALKLAVSERVPGICLAVLEAVGIMAYKNDSPFSVGRLLRDALSGQVMISNERIHSINAGLLPILKEA